MEITTKKGQAAACIRLRTSMDDLKREFEKGYGEIMGLLGKQGLQPCGAPFTIYHNMDMKDLDVEMGFPVGADFAASGRVVQGAIPGGRTAVTVHKGPYETIGETYNALTAFIAKSKAVPKGLCYESYLNDPQTTRPEELLTEICFPLND